MSNPDRDLLDQINSSWDEKVQRGRVPESEASGFTEAIEFLHESARPEAPSREFRERLRQQLALEHRTVASSESDTSFQADGQQPSPTPIQRQRAGDDAEAGPRSWLNHAGELAAIVAILIVAAAGVALWQSDDTGMLPGGSGDENDEVAIPTPEPSEPGQWNDVTFEEAQALTPFNLFVPENIPAGYALDNIMVMNLTEMAAQEDYALGEREDGDPFVTVVYEFQGDGDLIEIALQNLTSPGLEGDDPQQSPTSPPDQPRPPEDLSRGTLEVDGVEIMHTRYQDVEDRGLERELYVWFQDGLTVNATFPAIAPPEGEFMGMIESIIAGRENEDQPPVAKGVGIAEDDAQVRTQDDAADGPQTHDVETVEDAQEIVPFEVIDPGEAHESWELTAVEVTEPPVGDSFSVAFTMTHGENPDQRFIISQQNSHAAIPDIESSPQPVSPDGETSDDVDTPDPVQEEIEIDGLSVLRTIQYNLQGDQSTSYIWHQDETGISIYALTGVHEENINDLDPDHVIPADDLLDIVTAIVEARTSDDMPPEPEIQEPPQGHQAPPGGRIEVSLNEARDMAPFELIDTDLLPGELQFAGAELLRSEDGQPVDGDRPEVDDPNWTHLHFASPPDAEPQYVLEIVQTTDMIPNPEGEMLEIADHTVEYVEGPMGSSFQSGWIWNSGEIEYGVLMTVIDEGDQQSRSELDAERPISEDDIAPIVESTLR